MIEEGGEGVEQDNRELRWIVAYNDSRMGRTSSKKEGSEVEMSRESQLLTGEHVTKETLEDKGRVNDVHTYCSNTYLREVFHNLKEFWNSCLLTDLTLITENGNSFHVHAIVLAAVSSFIRDRLRQNTGKHAQRWSVSLAPEVDHVGLQAVVEFAYTGVVLSLNKDTFAQIKAAAQALEVRRVLDLCKEEQIEEFRNTKKEKKNISTLEQLKITLQCIEQFWVQRVGCDVILNVDGTLLYG